MPDRFCASENGLFVTSKYLKMTDWMHLLYHLTLFWILSDIFLHWVLEVNSSNSTIPESMPWCEPWNASQLITDPPPEPLPASRTQASKPDVDTNFTQTDAGSWILTCSLPWLSVGKHLYISRTLELSFERNGLAAMVVLRCVGNIDLLSLKDISLNTVHAKEHKKSNFS